ncbi:MAG: hypothetical protein PHS17_03310 [Desulfobacterales bacterium]|nr:hypothetical protein [Desulfobacterales bacterium]
MKKLILSILVILFLVGSALAADSVTVTPYVYGQKSGAIQKVLKVEWVDSPASTSLSDSFTTGDFESFLKGWYLHLAQTVPGSGAAQPDDNYDITLKTSGGYDVMGGTLANRDETNEEWAQPLAAGTYRSVPVNDDLLITVSGQATAAGTGTLWLYFHP